MKNFVAVLIVSIIIPDVFSQDSLAHSLALKSCFKAVQMDLETGKPRSEQLFCLGNTIIINLISGKIVRGKISAVKNDKFTLSTGDEIDASKIRWIKNNKMTTENAVVGGLLTASGLAIILYLSKGDVDLDVLPGYAIGAAALTILGIVKLTSHKKFRIARGDKLIFD